MAIIDIRNAQKLIIQAGRVRTTTASIEKLREELTAELQKVTSAWRSETVDKESYVKELKENIEKLTTLGTALTGLAPKLIEYAYDQIRTSNR